MDRCDTEPTWFLFSACGRPFMYVRDGNLFAISVFKRERRRRIGSTIELRSGNYAAATVDELMSAWPDPQITVADDGSFVYVAPHDLMEETCEDRS